MEMHFWYRSGSYNNINASVCERQQNATYRGVIG